MRIAVLLILISGAVPWWCCAGTFSFAPYYSESVRPQAEHSYFNPAFSYAAENELHEEGSRLPLGLLALITVPDRNPLLYSSDRETFRSEFDFLSMYDQLQYPTLFLLAPASSPEEVVAHVQAESLTITDQNGNALVFDTVAGAAGISKPFSPLLPPPLLNYRFGVGRIHSETGLFLASTGHSLTPDNDLREVLEGEPVQASSTYVLSASASATGGASQSLSYAFKLGDEREYVLLSPRVVGYYRALMAQARYEMELSIDDDGVPRNIDGDETIFLSHPDNGWGIGSRFDCGTLIGYEDFTAGLSLLNLIGVDYVEGEEISIVDSPEPSSRYSFGSDPVAVLSASQRFGLGSWTFMTAASTILQDAPSSHLSVSAFYGKIFMRLSGGYHGGAEGTVTAGLRGERRSISLTFGLHTSPFTHRPIPGIGVEASL